MYLNTLPEWSNGLGVQFSSQVEYNLPMDMLANIPLVNGPECETLGFNHSIDGYRQFSGPANLAGKRIISSEAGAAIYSAYQQTIPELLWDLKRSIVGGINQFVLHGYSFSGNYGNTTWPGFTPFGYAFSEMHGPHQPSWEFYDEWLSWTARTQFIAQSGVPRIDLALWPKLNSDENVTTQYAPTDLQEAGEFSILPIKRWYDWAADIWRQVTRMNISARTTSIFPKHTWQTEDLRRADRLSRP